MIKIEAFVREDKFEDVKEALAKIEVHGITVYQVMGCGIQKGYREVIRGNEVEINMLPKIKFEIIVSDEVWEKKTIKAIQTAAFTGNPGDGKNRHAFGLDDFDDTQFLKHLKYVLFCLKKKEVYLHYRVHKYLEHLGPFLKLIYTFYLNHRLLR